MDTDLVDRLRAHPWAAHDELRREAADALDAKDAEIERLHLAIINLTHPDLMMGGTWIQHYCRAEDLTEAGRLCKHVSDDKGQADES